MFIYFLLTLIPVGYFNYKLYNKLNTIHIMLFKLDKKLNYYLTYQYYIPEANEKNKDIYDLYSNSDVIISNSTAEKIIDYNNCLECSNHIICEKCKLLDNNKIYLIL